MAKISTSRLLYYWAPVVCLMGIIFIFSSQSAVQVTPTYWSEFTFKKTLHLIEYGVLAVLVYRALRNTYRLSLVNTFYISWLVASFYGFTDEFHQTFIPTREGRLRDVIIDALGAALALYCLYYISTTSRHGLIKRILHLLDIHA